MTKGEVRAAGNLSRSATGVTLGWMVEAGVIASSHSGIAIRDPDALPRKTGVP